jgi:inosine-uridine nucleoside N-ribohydrolase
MGFASLAVAQQTPVKLILDTDVDLDTDDALAMALLHALQSRGEANILAITVSTDDVWAAPFVSVINTFYGHSNIPIGVIRPGSMAKTADEVHKAMNVVQPKDYLRSLLGRRKEDGSFVYPRTLTDRSQAYDAVALLRKTLISQSDGSVTVIEIGPSTNLARLLESQGDEISPLNGRTLVKQKVGLLSIMGGSYFDIQYRGAIYPKGHPEWNLLMDPSSAQKIFENWPTPTVAEDCSLSPASVSPQSSGDVERDFGYVSDNPIIESVRLFTPAYNKETPPVSIVRWPHDVGFCDEYAAFYAVRKRSLYFSLSNPGKVTALNDGGSRFEEAPFGTHRILMLTDEQRSRTPEAIALLRSQPPAKEIDLH